MVEGGGTDHRNVQSEGKSSSIFSSVDKAQEWHWAIVFLHAYCIVAAQGCVVLSSTCVIQVAARPLWIQSWMRNGHSKKWSEWFEGAQDLLPGLHLGWHMLSGICCRCSIAVPAGVRSWSSQTWGQSSRSSSGEGGLRRGQCSCPCVPSSGCSTRWRAAVLTWRAMPSRRRRRRRWSSRRRRRRRRRQPGARPSRRRAATVGAAAAAAAAPARMKMEKYSSRPEVEGVARLDPTSLFVVSLFFCLHFFLPEPSGFGFSAAISSCHMFHFTLPVLNGG